jgi:nitrite reductase (NO-forming)
MKRFVITAVIVLLIVFGGVYFFKQSDSAVTGSTVQELTVEETKTFIINGENFKFTMNGLENPDIRVKEGERVKIEFVNEEGFHDWKIDEFNAATEKISAGATSSVEFVADKKGTFEYYCSVGSHRANGMKGNFIVE